MKKKKISFNCRGKKISLDVLECNILERSRCLMFRTKKNASALLFDFNKSVNLALTGIFVFFPFYVLWLDKQNKLLEIKLIKSFTPVVNIKKKFEKIIEIPINKKYRREIGVVVEMQKHLKT